MTVAKKKKTTAKKPATADRPASVTLTGDDAATVASAENSIKAKQQELGAVREQMVATEARLMQEIGQNRQQFQAVVKTMADKHGIDLTAGQWGFNVDTMTFSVTD